MALGQGGDVHIVWTDRRDGYFEVYYKRCQVDMSAAGIRGRDTFTGLGWVRQFWQTCLCRHLLCAYLSRQAEFNSQGRAHKVAQ